MTVDLKRLRIERGLGLAAASAAIGVPRSVLHRAETGTNVPHVKNALRIAEFYGLDLIEVWPSLLERDAA